MTETQQEPTIERHILDSEGHTLCGRERGPKDVRFASKRRLAMPEMCVDCVTVYEIES